MMTYIISYFIVNVIFTFKMVHNIYFVEHEPEEQQEMKDEFAFFLPATLLFGTIFLLIEYYFQSIEKD